MISCSNIFIFLHNTCYFVYIEMKSEVVMHEFLQIAFCETFNIIYSVKISDGRYCI